MARKRKADTSEKPEERACPLRAEQSQSQNQPASQQHRRNAVKSPTAIFEAAAPTVPKKRPSIRDLECVFFGFNAEELKGRDGVLAYYHSHPDELPDRVTVPMVWADEPPRDVEIVFDENVWEKEAPSGKGRTEVRVEDVAPDEVVLDDVDEAVANER